MTTSVTAGTGTAEPKGEGPARGGIELGHALRGTDGHPHSPRHVPPGSHGEPAGE